MENSERQNGTPGTTQQWPPDVAAAGPESQNTDPMNMAVEARSAVTGHEQPVFERVAELERQLRQAQAERDDAQAKLDRHRERRAAAHRRWRDKDPDAARRRNREANRAWRARRRAQLAAERQTTPPAAELDAQTTGPELAERQRRRQRNAAYMRDGGRAGASTQRNNFLSPVRYRSRAGPCPTSRVGPICAGCGASTGRPGTLLTAGRTPP